MCSSIDGPMPSYAELHCHSDFSFLDGASCADDLAERAREIGLAGLAVTDHNGLYGAVRFSTAAAEAGVHPVVGMEIELLDAAAPDPLGVVVPRRRKARRAPPSGPTLFGGSAQATDASATTPRDGQ